MYYILLQIDMLYEMLIKILVTVFIFDYVKKRKKLHVYYFNIYTYIC